jgi:hypothetical protein
MEPTTQTMIALGVLALLIALRRRRTGGFMPDEDSAERRAEDQAFLDIEDWRHGL